MWKRILAFGTFALACIDWIGRLLVADDIIKGRAADLGHQVIAVIPPSAAPVLMLVGIILFFWDVLDRRKRPHSSYKLVASAHSDPILCRDCKYFNDGGHGTLCLHPRSVNIVTGAPFTCIDTRADPNLCGRDAKWFAAS